MSMKKPAVLLALVGALRARSHGPGDPRGATNSCADPTQGTSASSLPVGDLDTALTSKNGADATPETDVTVERPGPGAPGRHHRPARRTGPIGRAALASINEAVAGTLPGAHARVWSASTTTLLDGFALKRARRRPGRDPRRERRPGGVPGARGARQRRWPPSMPRAAPGLRRAEGQDPGKPERPAHDAHRPGHPEGRRHRSSPSSTRVST